METVLQYEIPALHPLAVHFPIALLFAAAGVCVGWVATGRPFWRRATSLFLAAGTAGTLFAYLTGEAVYDLSRDVPIVEELVELHETLALVTLISSGLLSLGAVLLEFRLRPIPNDRPDTMSLRVAGFVLVLLVAGVVAFTGHVGAVMVWGVAR